MNPNNYFMIDIETTGVIPHKHYVTSVGVAHFHMDETGARVLNTHTFALQPDRTSRIKDPDTMAWRAKNDVGEHERLIEKQYPWSQLLTALVGLNNWMKDQVQGAKDIRVYAHHCAFDFGFLDSLYGEVNFGPYWRFWQVRDDETFVEAKCGKNFKEVAKSVKFDGHAHTAVDDAVFQVQVMDAAIKASLPAVVEAVESAPTPDGALHATGLSQRLAEDAAIETVKQVAAKDIAHG
jgi:DNA polymerase III alpha subunit (gram-positive type)